MIYFRVLSSKKFFLMFVITVLNPFYIIMSSKSSLTKKIAVSVRTATPLDAPTEVPYLSYDNETTSCMYPQSIGFWPEYDSKKRRWKYYSVNVREAALLRPGDFVILNEFTRIFSRMTGIHPLALQLVTTLETTFRPLAMPKSSSYTCGPFQLIKKNCPPRDSPVKMMTEGRYEDYINAYFSSAGIDIDEVRLIFPTLDIREQAARLYILTWASSAGKYFAKQEFPTDFVPYKDGMITGLKDYQTRFPGDFRPSSIEHARHVVDVLSHVMSNSNNFFIIKTPRTWTLQP